MHPTPAPSHPFLSQPFWVYGGNKPEQSALYCCYCETTLIQPPASLPSLWKLQQGQNEWGGDQWNRKEQMDREKWDWCHKAKDQDRGLMAWLPSNHHLYQRQRCTQEWGFWSETNRKMSTSEHRWEGSEWGQGWAEGDFSTIRGKSRSKQRKNISSKAKPTFQFSQLPCRQAGAVGSVERAVRWPGGPGSRPQQHGGGSADCSSWWAEDLESM